MLQKQSDKKNWSVYNTGIITPPERCHWAAIAHALPSLSKLRRHHMMCCATARRMIEMPTGGRKSSFSFILVSIWDSLIQLQKSAY